MRAQAAALFALSLSAPALACPVGQKVSVDNDTPGSGYSEVKPENWVSHSVGACKGNYRYLSAYVGDGTRKGKALWQPKITTAGMYEVTTSFRASVNRTNDADYVLYDDKGGTQKKSVNQTLGDGCTKVVIGSVYCAVGGSCRLVLDGDDGKSDAADETVFVLKSCDTGADAGPPGPCAGIAAVAAYQVCAETATTCAGVYDNGAGCTAYCAATGMVCTARFGAGTGCSKEAQNPYPCGANNGHLSNWCECAYPSGSGGAGGSGGSPSGGGGAPSGGGTASGGEAGVPAGGQAGHAGAGGSGAGWPGTGASIGKEDAGPGVSGGTTEEDSGCGCRTSGHESVGLSACLFALAALALGRRRPRG
ncbi:MAG: hypothetical protein IT377_01535 [Polyangiaceae bacterium]|nr:hypothetical protein [Polyangiaceae bacterium]